MGAPTNTQKIDDLRNTAATLTARLDAIEKRLDRLDQDCAERRDESIKTDKGLSLLSRDIEQINIRLNEAHSRRWDVYKIVFACILTALLTLLVAAGTLAIEHVVKVPRNPLQTFPGEAGI